MQPNDVICPREDTVEYCADDSPRGTLSGAVAVFLEHWRKAMGLREIPMFPQVFLLELGAILRIDHWQRTAALVDLAFRIRSSDCYCELAMGATATTHWFFANNQLRSSVRLITVLLESGCAIAHGSESSNSAGMSQLRIQTSLS